MDYCAIYYLHCVIAEMFSDVSWCVINVLPIIYIADCCWAVIYYVSVCIPLN